MNRPFYGWAIVAVATVATFCSGPGQSYVFSIFVDPILADTGLSRVYLSALYAFGTGVSAVMVVVVARMVDRFGARLMLAVISVTLALACFGMSFAAGPLALFAGFAALRALGQGSLPVTATMLTAQWFVKHRGRAVSVVILGVAASNAVLPPLSQWLISGFGWRTAYVALGGMVLVLLLPAALLVVRDRPEALGLHPDGASTPVEEPNTTGRGESKVGLGRVLASPDFWLLAVPLAAVPFVSTALVFHQVSILGEQGVSAAVAAGVFVAFAAASASGTLLTGPLTDRLDPKVSLLASLTLLLMAMVALTQTSGPVTAATYAAILGAASGMQGVLAGMAWAHYFGRRGLGRVQGPATMVMISAAALAPLPLAALHQLFGGYGPALLLMMALPVLCAVMTVLFNPHRARRYLEGV